MNTLKNLIIAILTGLLALSLSTQTSNGATAKTYDAVKLIQYDRCLDYVNHQPNVPLTYESQFRAWLTLCGAWRP